MTYYTKELLLDTLGMLSLMLLFGILLFLPNVLGTN